MYTKNEVVSKCYIPEESVPKLNDGKRVMNVQRISISEHATKTVLKCKL